MKSRIYEKLKSDLILGRLRPGIFLQEKQLAAAFGVSKTPVREALADLVKERFIQLIPRKGYWIAPIDPQETREVLEFRMILECAAAELAAERVTESEIKAMVGLILPQPAGGGRGFGHAQIERHGKANILFHRQLARASGNRALAAAHGHVMDELTRSVFLSYSFPKISETAGDHELIVEALRRRDPPGARAAVARHLEASGRRLLAGLTGERSGLVDRPEPARRGAR